MDESNYRITYSEDAEGRSILRYSGDMQALLDACAREARENRENRIPAARRKRRRIMSVDPLILMKVAHEHGIPYWDLDALFEKLKGRDYSRLRMVDDTLLWSSRRRR